MVLALLANGLAKLEDYPDAAFASFDRGFQPATSISNPTGAATCLAAQAFIQYERGDAPGAASLLLRAADLCKSGAPAAFGGWLGFAALVLEAAGDDEASATLRGAPPVVAGRSVIGLAHDRRQRWVALCALLSTLHEPE
jgi:hypothetical protein